jgi:S-adenosylmethionine:tRNA ribosyltransferase-isomerase
MYNLSDYHYDLSEDLIAQHPKKQRDHSRLLRLDRKSGQAEHHFFHEVAEFLRPEDILVVNNTQVIPARLFGTKESGGKAEVLLLEYSESSGDKQSENNCVIKCLIKASKHLKPGNVIYFDEGLHATVVNVENGCYHAKFSCPGNFDDILHRVGKMPIPPYIRRDQKSGDFSEDKTSYQTVYASQKGAVAAPTAGLHFTEKLLDNIRKKGIKIVPITLHVGYGTFVPVRVSDIREHRIHSERFDISEKTAEIINDGIRQNRRIVAVGTTCVRTLEYALNKNGQIVPGSDTCDLFIYPGYRFKVVDAMITNFHLPESTLIMLVSAFAGRENILAAYKNAIENNYRFYSYGDAMFIE